MTIEEDQGTQRLGLRRCAHALHHRQMREEGVDLVRSHRRRMRATVVHDESAGPEDIGLFRPSAVVPRADRTTYAIEKPRSITHLPEAPSVRRSCQFIYRR